MKEKLDKISTEINKISKDPKVIERGKELQRKLSTLTAEDLQRRYGPVAQTG